MDWNALKTFLAIARNGTLAGAAREMKVNHSTVFRRLNALEESFGCRLFERLNDGYQLTSVGESLIEHSEQIASSFDDLERQLSGQDSRPSGSVRLTAPENIAFHYLPQYLARFHQQYPEIEVELVISNQDFNLSKREADIAIRATSNPPEHLIGRKLSEIPWSIYSSQNYFSGIASEQENTPSFPSSGKQLKGHRLIGADGELCRLPGYRWLEKHYGDQIVTTGNSLVAMSYLAEAGLGLALLPDDQNRIELNRLFPLEQAQKSHLWILTHPDLRHVQRVQLLIRHLTNSISKEPRLGFVNK